MDENPRISVFAHLVLEYGGQSSSPVSLSATGARPHRGPHKRYTIHAPADVTCWGAVSVVSQRPRASHPTRASERRRVAPPEARRRGPLETPRAPPAQRRGRGRSLTRHRGPHKRYTRTGRRDVMGGGSQCGVSASESEPPCTRASERRRVAPRAPSRAAGDAPPPPPAQRRVPGSGAALSRATSP